MQFQIRAPFAHLTPVVFTLSFALLASAVFALPQRAHAQQFAVDDAGITEAGACQIEAWWGEAEQFFLPACTLLPRTEVSLGAARFDRGNGILETHATLEAKWMGRDPEANLWGWGVVVGSAFAAQRSPREASQVYAYVPVTLHLEQLSLDLHANAGWVREQEVHGDHTHIHNGVSLGLRGDLAVATRLQLIGEVSGVVGDPLEAQLGVRLVMLEDVLSLDLSHGFLPTTSERGLGWQVGLAWTPSPFRP